MRTPKNQNLKTNYLKRNPKIPHNHVRHVRFLFFFCYMQNANIKHFLDRHAITERQHQQQQQQQTNENKSEERTRKKSDFIPLGASNCIFMQ